VLALVLAVPVAAPAVDRSYQVHYLVSDGFVPADHTDPNLVNAWGVAFNPFAFVWVADNATGVATLYDGNGVPQSLVVTIPGGSPTGIVFNGSTTDFVVHQGTLSGAAAFLFATEKGVIAGWSPGVNRTNAIVAADSSASGAIYKGLALAGTGNGFQLYATDFHNGKIDVFDSAFHPVTAPGGFTDPTIPRNFAPFGIQNLNGNIYVTYAKQDDEREDDVHGPGLGFVNVFDPNGNLIRRVASRGTLNAPWGLALAPADFGAFSNQLLVGNFGDGTISAYDERSGKFTGQLLAPNSRPLVIDGLWGLSFGNGVLNQPTNTLFFAAGPDDENHGAYGRIEPTVR
jgi:uncharacterized protein (TIGR03118 family)